MAAKYEPVLLPMEHQSQGTSRLLCGGVLNADEQGLGKTKQCYDAVAKLYERGEIELAILIVKASLRDHLLKEIQSDANQLRAMVISGTKRERILSYKFLSHHILVLSYETATADRAELLRLIRNNKTLIALDESHYIKNAKASRTTAVLELSQFAEKTMAFSGTPLPNGTKDLFTQLKFLGHRVGESAKEFEKRYSDKEDLKDLVRSILIRRRKHEVRGVNIPEKRIHTVEVQLTKKQRNLYRQAVDCLVLEYQESKSDKKTIPINGLLAKFTRLLQITSNPRTLFSNYSDDPIKFLELDKLLESKLVIKDSKVIIWTNYRRNVEELSARYAKYGAVALFGGVPPSQRTYNVTRFQNSSRVRVLIAVPACAREGFTLTAANTAIYIDRNFSALDWLQSQDRIHRMGQSKRCDIIVLKAADTIESLVDSLLERKEGTQRHILGDSQNFQSKKISIDEALDILKQSRG